MRIMIEGGIPRVAHLDQEWFEDVENPDLLVDTIRKTKPTPDIFTFWQRLPEMEPKYSYRMERDAIAALPIRTTHIGGRNNSIAQLETRSEKPKRRELMCG